jgi:Tfp pilus assembly protein PilF
VPNFGEDLDLEGVDDVFDSHHPLHNFPPQQQGPSLPQAYVDRASAYLQWGDAAGAQADATKATHLCPHHADAWKLWGDVLAKQGHGKEALTKYDEALKYAPNWKQLQEARETAANQKT